MKCVAVFLSLHGGLATSHGQGSGLFCEHLHPLSSWHLDDVYLIQDLVVDTVRTDSAITGQNQDAVRSVKCRVPAGRIVQQNFGGDPVGLRR